MAHTERARRWKAARAVAVGLGLVVGAAGNPGEGAAQMPAPSAGAPGVSRSVQPRAAPSPGVSVEQRRGWGDAQRWDRHQPQRPYHGYYSHDGYRHGGYSGPGYYPPRYGYAYPGPYGTYPGRWVWDGWNWVFVPIY